MIRIAALTAAPLLLYSPPAFAWGGLGHEAVCELAFLELDDTARQRVLALIRQDEEFNTFRASCNWPDRPRQRPAEHFVNLPRDAAGIGEDACPLAEKCVVTAIEDDFAVLASPDATDEEKLEALKFLGHWVGDIHQPMHASFEDDRGGNMSAQKAAPATTCMRSGTDASSRSGSGWTRSRSWANSGQHHRCATRRVAGQRCRRLGKRIFAIARAPDVGYCVMVGDACQYEAYNHELDEGEPKKVVQVDDAYLDRHAPVARERIAMAGVRLAGLLRQALGDQGPRDWLEGRAAQGGSKPSAAPLRSCGRQLRRSGDRDSGARSTAHGSRATVPTGTGRI